MLVVLLKLLLCWLVFGCGMLHAFFPIDDQETSTGHRVFTLLLTLIALAAIISV